MGKIPKIILLVIVVLVIISVIYTTDIYMGRSDKPGPGPHEGEAPDFSVTLVDDNENDYIDIEFVESGTGFYEADYYLATALIIKIRSVEDPEDYFRLRLGDLEEFHKVRLHLGESIRVFFDANVVESGKLYTVDIQIYEAVSRHKVKAK